MLIGFVGLIDTLVMWPLFFLLHSAKLEVFVWPTLQQWQYIALNGLVGTVLSEFLWLWYDTLQLLSTYILYFLFCS